jgi:lysylphosphatidylglycerol synthetase-like protein (DUF2156 family)
MTQRSIAGAPGPVAGFEVAETFPNTMEFDHLRPGLLAQLLVLFVFCTLVLGCLFGAFSLAGGGWLVAGAASAGLCAAYVAARRRRFAVTTATSVLEISPDGLVSTGRYLRVELPWSGLRGLARVNPFDADSVLVGTGSTTVTADAPWHLRGQAGSAGTIPLANYTDTADWRAERIGQWIQAYRPDLR